MPERRRAVAAVRAVAVAPSAPAPAKPAGKRCLPVSQTLSRLRAKGKVRGCVNVCRMSVPVRVRILTEPLVCREQTAFIPYITAGDPDLTTTAEALRLLDACGADVIELGMPFSDPNADGPIIQARTPS